MVGIEQPTQMDKPRLLGKSLWRNDVYFFMMLFFWPAVLLILLVILIVTSLSYLFPDV